MSVFPSGGGLRARVLPRFPANVVAGNGIAIDKDGARYTFSITDALGSLGALPTAPGMTIYSTDEFKWAETPFPQYGRSIAGSATEQAFKAHTNLVTGEDVQAWDADLDALAALTGSGYPRRISEGAWAIDAGTGGGGGDSERAFFDTKLEVESVAVEPGVSVIQTFGYSAIDDRGGAVYRRKTTEPTHPGKIQDGGGAWWELISDTVTIEMFGGRETNRAAVPIAPELAINDDAIADLIEYVQSPANNTKKNIRFGPVTYWFGRAWPVISDSVSLFIQGHGMSSTGLGFSYNSVDPEDDGCITFFSNRARGALIRELSIAAVLPPGTTENRRMGAAIRFQSARSDGTDPALDPANTVNDTAAAIAFCALDRVNITYTPMRAPQFEGDTAAVPFSAYFHKDIWVDGNDNRGFFRPAIPVVISPPPGHPGAPAASHVSPGARAVNITNCDFFESSWREDWKVVSFNNGPGQIDQEVVVTTRLPPTGSTAGAPTPHGFVAGDIFQFLLLVNGVNLPQPLSIGQAYWVIADGLTATTFKLSARKNGVPFVMQGLGTVEDPPKNIQMRRFRHTVVADNVVAFHMTACSVFGSMRISGATLEAQEDPSGGEGDHVFIVGTQIGGNLLIENTGTAYVAATSCIALHVGGGSIIGNFRGGHISASVNGVSNFSANTFTIDAAALPFSGGDAVTYTNTFGVDPPLVITPDFFAAPGTIRTVVSNIAGNQVIELPSPNNIGGANKYLTFIKRNTGNLDIFCPGIGIDGIAPGTPYRIIAPNQVTIGVEGSAYRIVAGFMREQVGGLLGIPVAGLQVPRKLTKEEALDLLDLGTSSTVEGANVIGTTSVQVGTNGRLQFGVPTSDYNLTHSANRITGSGGTFTVNEAIHLPMQITTTLVDGSRFSRVAEFASDIAAPAVGDQAWISLVASLGSPGFQQVEFGRIGWESLNIVAASSEGRIAFWLRGTNLMTERVFIEDGGIRQLANTALMWGEPTADVTVTHSTGKLAVDKVFQVCSSVAPPAGGSTASRLLMGNSGSLGIYFGSGPPTSNGGTQGSIYVNTTGSTTTTRIYVHTGAGWTHIVTAA